MKITFIGLTAIPGIFYTGEILDVFESGCHVRVVSPEEHDGLETYIFDDDITGWGY